MPVRKIVPNTRAAHMRVGVVVARFNPEIGEILLAGALRALDAAGVADAVHVEGLHAVVRLAE
jgi:6,7-dimethyl-8-ribityllumazine synthase